MGCEELAQDVSGHTARNLAKNSPPEAYLLLVASRDTNASSSRGRGWGLWKIAIGWDMKRFGEIYSVICAELVFLRFLRGDHSLFIETVWKCFVSGVVPRFFLNKIASSEGSPGLTNKIVYRCLYWAETVPGSVYLPSVYR